MTVTPDSDSAPWDGAARDPYRPLQQTPPPVQPVRPPRSRLRWLLGLVGGMLIIGSLAVLFVLANPPAPSAGASRLASYVPDTAVGYFELRLDLPGDQRQHVLGLLSRFPGLDEGGLEEKFNELLAELGKQGIEWERDIDPWFDGQLALAFDEPTGTTLAPDGPAYTAILALKDRASFLELIERHGLADDLEPAPDYAGASVWVGEPSYQTLAVGLTEDAVLLASGLTELHAALDTNAGQRTSLADQAAFKDSVAALHRDRLAFAYLDPGRVAESLAAAIEGEELPFDFGSQMGQLPWVVVMELRAEADHLLLESRNLPRPGVSLPPPPPSRSTQLASFFPAGTLAYVEVREVGAGIKQAIEQLSELSGDMGGEFEMPLEVEQLLGTRLEDFFDFLGDTAVGLSSDGTRISGGLVGQLHDEQAARQRLERLVASLRMMLAFGGSDVPLTITDERHGDVSVTVFRLREMPGMEAPFSSFSFAVANGRLIVGFDDFVSLALDGGPAASLAESTSYKRALTAAGAENGGLLFIDIGGLRGMLESVMLPAERGDYEELKPYLEPFGQLVMSVSSSGESQIQRTMLFLEE